MNKQLEILTTVLEESVRRHGVNTPVTLGHLLNICKLATKFETVVDEHYEKQHLELMKEIDPFGQG
jgi:hypothetical protein